MFNAALFKRLSTSFVLFITLALSQMAWSHGGTHTTVDAKQAVSISQSAASKMSKKNYGLSFGQLPVSWAGVKASDISLKQELKNFFVMAVNNPQEGKTLYVLVGKNGDVYDANFTGEFSKAE